MAAVEEYLVRRGDGLVLLFTPPFDRTPLDPGYIKGYLPGVRENGGQYTHAAHLVGHRLRGARRRRQGGRAVRDPEPDQPREHAGGPAPLQGRGPTSLAADIYAEPPHVGRGGWTWYTGSAGWMYRAGIEWILGFRLRGTTLHLDPCIPRAWPGSRSPSATTRRATSSRSRTPRGATAGVTKVTLDGKPCTTPEIPSSDGETHTIEVVLG